VNEVEDDFYEPPRRRGSGKVIVTLVLLAAVALGAWAAEKRFHLVALIERAAHPGSAETQADPRAGPLLVEGERALLAGDLEGAQAAFDKASVLVDRDPRGLLDLARVAAAKADVPWLELRLLPPEATDEARVARAELAEHAAAAQRAAQDAFSARADDPQVLRARIDALRVSGDVDAARSYVVAVFGQASQPETAYVLAALEMAQPAPPWPSIIDRLRFAAAGEWSTGRARAALVYALARSGDAAGARAEMAKLDALARPYPCLAQLRAMLGAPGVDAGVAQPAPADAGAADAGAGAQAARGSGQAAPWVSSGEPGDNPASGALAAASEALAGRDYARAEQIYQAILTSEPRDSQALGGLGDIARARGDSQGAIAAYRRAIAVNPSYLPSLLGLADTQWAHGDHAAAVSGYRNIEDHFPEGTYPAYVRQRASGAQ
jgi:tetratricopeptide (TPR) repeat protein